MTEINNKVNTISNILNISDIDNIYQLLFYFNWNTNNILNCENLEKINVLCGSSLKVDLNYKEVDYCMICLDHLN